MMTLLCGENAYERDQYVHTHAPNAAIIDGAGLDSAGLRQYLYGVSLFAAQSVVIITELSANKAQWDELGELLSPATVEQANVLLIEPKPDKRTKTYKALKKYATIIEHAPFGERDTGKVAQWLLQLASEQKIPLERAAATELVERIGVDQYRLLHELERLAVMGEVTVAQVQRYTPASPKDTAFTLLETAVTGDVVRLREQLQAAQALNEPYMLLGLLVSQVYAVAGLVMAPEVSSSDLASSLQVHPFVLRNLQGVARRCTPDDVRRMVDALAEADYRMKNTDTDPWSAISTALLAVANVAPAVQ